jgi:hypothetical protein
LTGRSWTILSPQTRQERTRSLAAIITPRAADGGGSVDSSWTAAALTARWNGWGYLRTRSRISVNNRTSGVGAEEGGSSLFNLLIPLIARKSTQAIMRKLIVMVRNWPHPSTAPCFLASA